MRLRLLVVAGAACALPPDHLAGEDARPVDVGPDRRDAAEAVDRPRPEPRPDGVGAELGAAGRPRAILMIGDGMGPGHIEAASLYAHGAPGMLFMQSLPVHGVIETDSLSGTTDSGAAATTMATGERTHNYLVGLDRFGQPAKNLVERAHELGQSAGLVTTASLPHATPASFSAHRSSRFDYLNIADDQALIVRPEVMLGGGEWFYLPKGPGSQRSDDGLLAPLGEAGWQVTRTATELDAVLPTALRIVGVFAPEHLQFSFNRPPDTTEPTLAAMALRALEALDQDPDGFFLMIEGARIDMASHANDLRNAVGETLAFDEAVAAVAAWAETRADTIVIVTADHDCGNPEVVAPGRAGTLPNVRWSGGAHTSTPVNLFGLGLGIEAFQDARGDHTWVHEALLSRLEGRPFIGL